MGKGYEVVKEGVLLLRGEFLEIFPSTQSLSLLRISLCVVAPPRLSVNFRFFTP